MHAPCLRVLQKLLNLDKPIHLARRKVVVDAVIAVFRAPRSSLTRLGYALSRSTTAKHRVKCIDRLLGNEHLQGERLALYGRLAQFLIRANPQPVVVVDWSPLCADQRWQLLRASVAVKGRALTLYEEVHPQSMLGSRKVQKRFLEQLALLVPPKCQPLIVTDAGFKNPWFKAVEALGWQWLGRVRGQVLVSRPGESLWMPVRMLYALATTQAQSLGPLQVTRSNPVTATAVLYRQASKGRHGTTLNGGPARSKADRQCARTAREPWLLIACAQLAEWPAARLVRVYRQRMQIEEGFRDTKSAAFGFGLYPVRSRFHERAQVLLLLVALAMMLAWLVGYWVQRQGYAPAYQVNTVKHRSVLSCVSLGLLFLTDPKCPFRPPAVLELWGLQEDIAQIQRSIVDG